MMRDCLVCQKQFTIKSAGNIYCSIQCKLKTHEQICNNCGIVFSNLAKRKFCSLSCSSKRVRKPNCNLHKCQQCGEEYISKGYRKGIKYCSIKCSSKANSGEIQSLRIHGSKRGKSRATTIYSILPSVRSGIFKRMKLGCSRCGWNKANCDLHHINGRKISNPHDQSNLSYLCPNCHREAANNLIPKDEIVPFSVQVGMKWKEFYYGSR